MDNKAFAIEHRGKRVTDGVKEGIVVGYCKFDDDILVKITKGEGFEATSDSWPHNVVILDPWEGKEEVEWLNANNLTLVSDNKMPTIEAGNIVETEYGFYLALPSGSEGNKLRLYNKDLTGGSNLSDFEVLGIYTKDSYFHYKGVFNSDNIREHLKPLWTKPVEIVKTEAELKVEKLRATIKDAFEQIKVIEGDK